MTKKTKIGCSVGFLVALGVLVAVVGAFLWRAKRAFQWERRDVILTSAAYDAERLREARPLLEEMVPRAATNIELRLVYTRGGLMGAPKDKYEIGGFGSNVEVRCEVSKEGLAEFAKENKYAFQSESYVKNFCTDERADAQCCDWFGSVYERYNGNRKYPKNFLSYNCIYPSCAGFSFFYDVEKNVLYGHWGSN